MNMFNCTPPPCMVVYYATSRPGTTVMSVPDCTQVTVASFVIRRGVKQRA